MVGPENVLRRPTQHEEPLADFEVAVHGSAQHGSHAVVARARLASVRGTAVHEHPLGHLMGVSRDDEKEIQKHDNGNADNESV